MFTRVHKTCWRWRVSRISRDHSSNNEYFEPRFSGENQNIMKNTRFENIKKGSSYIFSLLLFFFFNLFTTSWVVLFIERFKYADCFFFFFLLGYY